MFFSILKKTADVSILAAALAFSACGSDSDSSATSAPETLSPASSGSTDSNNVATSSSSDGNSSGSETGSSSSPKANTKLAWEFMNPNIDYIEFTDERDGLVYRAVVIGEQTWMAQNLSYNQFAEYLHNDCPGATNPDSCGKYGILYDFNDRNKVCPNGWHLPTSKDWDTLFNFVGASGDATKKLRTTTGWKARSSDEEDRNGTDDFGFSAYPAGHMRYISIEGLGEHARFWTSSMGGVGPMIIESDYDYFRSTQTTTQSTDKSTIRCIKDSIETELSAE